MSAPADSGPDPAGAPEASRRRGIVLRDEGSQLIVDCDGEEILCVVRKTLRHRAGRRRKPVAVGDRVQIEFSGEGAAVCAVEPRRSQLSRPDPGDPRREQILVANLDQVLVVGTARQPDPVPGLIDRFLVAVESRELEVLIAINKVDLDPERSWEPAIAVYRDLGYRVAPISARTGEGLEVVRTWLADRTTTMLGHSGVGKSSIANALDPTLRIRTAEVHESTGQGLHTTTTVHLLRLPWGGYLVDTPGIRAFGLWNIDERDLGFWFREFAARLHDCRFNDCLHRTEPGCAILAAVESGQLPRWRHESYLRILQTLREETPDHW